MSAAAAQVKPGGGIFEKRRENRETGEIRAFLKIPKREKREIKGILLSEKIEKSEKFRDVLGAGDWGVEFDADWQLAEWGGNLRRLTTSNVASGSAATISFGYGCSGRNDRSQ